MQGSEFSRRILVVDDEPAVRTGIAQVLSRQELAVTTAADAAQALEHLARQSFAIVLLDIKLPDLDGVEVLKLLRRDFPETEVIMITGYPTIQGAVECIKLGALDYLVKPFRIDELEVVVQKAREHLAQKGPRGGPESREAHDLGLDFIIGASPAMKQVFAKIKRAAPSDSTVLLTGESGTGKELVARAIHLLSPRSGKEFVPVDCSALVETLLESELFGHVKGSFTSAVGDKKGLVEEADKGTLFLDEIGELSPPLQVKLLRVLQEGEFTRIGDTQPRRVNVRVIAATNRDLKKAIADKSFREDLYYRLNVIPIELPPLRRRKDDIPLLVNHFIDKHKGKAPEKNITGISKEAMHVLLVYHFPGNVRELENSIEYAIAFTAGPVVQKDDLPKYILEEKKLSQEAQKIPIMPLKDAKGQFEKSLIIAALIESGGNISEAARLLNVHRQNLQQKIRLLGIDLASISPAR